MNSVVIFIRLELEIKLPDEVATGQNLEKKKYFYGYIYGYCLLISPLFNFNKHYTLIFAIKYTHIDLYNRLRVELKFYLFSWLVCHSDYSCQRLLLHKQFDSLGYGQSVDIPALSLNVYDKSNRRNCQFFIKNQTEIKQNIPRHLGQKMGVARAVI